MGQMTYALLYGIEHPEGVDLFGEGIGSGGLMREWENACKPQIDAFVARCKRHESRFGARDRYIPDSPYQSTLPLLGFYVAAGASGMTGIPYLEGFAISEVRDLYAKECKNARRRWRRFAKWCASKGITLPKARLYLTETEVG